jgi:putative tricarboxylic transport membrane protein
VIGAFSMNNSLFDVGVVLVCGFVAYGLRKAGFDMAPLLLAFLLGSLLEENIRQALVLGLGSPLVFAQSPISLTVLLFTAVIMLVPVVKRLGAGMTEKRY